MQQKSYLFGIVVSVLVLLSGYVGSYLALTEKASAPVRGRSIAVRLCDYEWMTVAYRPLASIEGRMTGRQIDLVGPVF